MKQFNSGSMVIVPSVLRLGVGLGCPDGKEAVPFGRTVTLIETGVFEGTWALGDPIHILITRKEDVQLNLGVEKCFRSPRETEKPFLTRVPYCLPLASRGQ